MAVTACSQRSIRSRAAPRSRRAPPHQPTTTPGLGGPGRVRRPHPATAPNTASPSPGHPEHDPALAPPPRRPTMGLPPPDRTTTDRRRPRRPGSAHGPGEPALGIPADPGRAAHTRPPRRRLDDRTDPPAPPHPTSTFAAHRHQLAAVPAHPGHHHARGRLLPRRLRAHRATPLRPVRTRGRRPLPARPGRDRTSRRTQVLGGLINQYEPAACVVIALSLRTRSCAGIAASSAGDGPTRPGPGGHRSTTSSPPWWCGWRGRTHAGGTHRSRASCSSSATASAPRRSGGSFGATASHRHRSGAPTPVGGSSCGLQRHGDRYRYRGANTS
jgi:hypothetical protein